MGLALVAVHVVFYILFVLEFLVSPHLHISVGDAMASVVARWVLLRLLLQVGNY
jgi:hypothetical protein